MICPCLCPEKEMLLLGKNIFIGEYCKPTVEAGDIFNQGFRDAVKVIAITWLKPCTNPNHLKNIGDFAVFEENGVFYWKVRSNKTKPVQVLDGEEINTIPYGLEYCLGNNREYLTYLGQGKFKFTKYLGEGCGKRCEQIQL